MGSLALVWLPVKQKENSQFKTIKIRLEIDLVLHPARTEELVNRFIFFFAVIYVTNILHSYACLLKIRNAYPL